MDSNIPKSYQDICTLVGQLYLEKQDKILSLENRILELTLELQKLRGVDEST